MSILTKNPWRNKRQRRRNGRVSGGIVIALTSILGVGAVALLFMQLFEHSLLVSTKKIKSTRFQVSLVSAVETTALAYKLAEIAYNNGIKACTTTANPFLRALLEGHGCPGITVKVFGDADASMISVADLYSYSHPGGCKMEETKGIECDGTAIPVEVTKIGVAEAEKTQRIDSNSFRFVLNSVVPKKEITEFVTKITPDKGNQMRRGFAIRAAASNLAHLEADGRVTQENPDTMSRCPGDQWATYRIYDEPSKACQEFTQLGSGTGLAFYDGRFFGFRPMDGQIIDMLKASQSSSYLVNTDGTVSGESVFVPYDKDALINVDDITVISEQVYYVSGQGSSAKIGALALDSNLAPSPRIPLCQLGAMGWSQAYTGIASLSWSDALLPTDTAAANSDSPRLATFYLKTDGGDLLTAQLTVRKPQVGDDMTCSSSCCTEFTYAGIKLHSCCSVFKDANLQQIEYKRTLGFDRTETTKPYYVY